MEGKTGIYIESFLYCIQEKGLGSCGNAGKLTSWREKTVTMFDEAPAAAPPQAEPHQALRSLLLRSIHGFPCLFSCIK